MIHNDLIKGFHSVFESWETFLKPNADGSLDPAVSALLMKSEELCTDWPPVPLQSSIDFGNFICAGMWIYLQGAKWSLKLSIFKREEL